MAKRVLFVGTLEDMEVAIEDKFKELRDVQNHMGQEDDTALEQYEEQIIDELYGEYEMFTEQELKELEELEEAEQAYWEEVRQAELDLYKEVK